MKTRNLGNQGLVVSELGLGCMGRISIRICKLWKK